MNFRAIVVVTGLILVALVVTAIGGSVLVLLAYGAGLLVNLVLHLEPFQVTALTLAGMIVTGILVARLLSLLLPEPFPTVGPDYDDDEDEDDDYDDEDDGDAAERRPGAPRWQEPPEPLDFSRVKPDDRCPCGSGRKYKNCHGSAQARQARS